MLLLLKYEKCKGDKLQLMKELIPQYPPMGHGRSEDFLREMMSLRLLANSTGKCIDDRVKSKTCKACSYWKGKTDAKSEKFRRIHKCPLNHTKSSGVMGADGVLERFLSSVIKRQLRYLTYIGDGDTKSYQNVVNANPYPGYEIVKTGCGWPCTKTCWNEATEI